MTGLRAAAALMATASLFIATPAIADVLAGVTAWERGDYATAVREWRPLAERGDADAQFNLAQAYKLGRGVPIDLERAAELYRRAAVQNHLQAADNLGLVLYDLQRREEAMPYLVQSADRGEPRAQFVLGAELFNGERVSRDWPRAYALMKRAADQGLDRATAALAQMDGAIPLAQRQQGLELARRMETGERSARLAAVSGAATSPNQPVTRPLPTPPAATAPARAPASTTSAASAPRAAPPSPTRPTPPSPAPRSAAPLSASAPASTGRFHVQLGAFSTRQRAEAAWTGFRGRLNGAQPRYVAAGSVTRLQAGPFATRADAQAACARAGGGCFIVSP